MHIPCSDVSLWCSWRYDHIVGNWLIELLDQSIPQQADLRIRDGRAEAWNRPSGMWERITLKGVPSRSRHPGVGKPIGVELTRLEKSFQYSKSSQLLYFSGTFFTFSYFLEHACGMRAVIWIPPREVTARSLFSECREATFTERLLSLLILCHKIFSCVPATI